MIISKGDLSHQKTFCPWSTIQFLCALVNSNGSFSCPSVNFGLVDLTNGDRLIVFFKHTDVQTLLRMDKLWPSSFFSSSFHVEWHDLPMDLVKTIHGTLITTVGLPDLGLSLRLLPVVWCLHQLAYPKMSGYFFFRFFLPLRDHFATFDSWTSMWHENKRQKKSILFSSNRLVQILHVE